MASATSSAVIPAPSGEVTDFDAPNELWKWNVLCQAMSLGVPGIMFLLRLYVRIWVKRVWILEDYLSVLSYIGLVAYGSLLTTVIYHRGGVHEWDITSPTAQSISFWVNIVQIEYGPTAAIIKSTILLLYLRVFSPRRWTAFDNAIRGFILIVCLFYTGLTFAKIFQCVPREKIWIPSTQGTCVNLAALLDASGLFNIISDTAILLVPIKGLWTLHVSFKKKIGIYAVFTVGVIGPVFSIVGLVKRFQLATSTDSSYNQPTILLWAMAEIATGMMIICLPTLPGILQARRKHQPSRSILEGSSHSSRPANASRYSTKDGYAMPDSDKRPLRNVYIELSDNHQEFPAAGIQTGGITNHIQGGHGPVELNESGELHANEGNILKTVTLEQSRRY